MDNNSILNKVGNTPLVRLKQASELTGCNIYGKAEYMNPGESIKDRAALFIVKDALEKKLIKKGGTIVEGTAGNTGIGLAIVCKEYDLKCIIVIPKTQSVEKKETLKKYGATLIEVDAVPYSNPKIILNSQNKSHLSKPKIIKMEFLGNQFDNIVNSEAHIKTTAEEIWNQTAGKVDAFICSVGTGGTLAGVSIGLKKKRKNILIGLADPMGSSLYSYINEKELKSYGSSITEGIGTSRITKNFEKSLVDVAFQIEDKEALEIVYDLIERQKIILGDLLESILLGQFDLQKK